MAEIIDFKSIRPPEEPVTITTRELATILQILEKIPARHRAHLLDSLKNPELYRNQ